MDQFLLLTQQMKVNVEGVEQQLRHLYDPHCSIEYKRLVLQYAFVQGRSLEDLLNAYYRQLQGLERSFR